MNVFYIDAARRSRQSFIEQEEVSNSGPGICAFFAGLGLMMFAFGFVASIIWLVLGLA